MFSDNKFAADSLQKLKDANVSPISEGTVIDTNSIIHESLSSEDYETQEIAANCVFKWPNDAILLLIEEYRLRVVDYHSGKISQKKIWAAIANQLIAKGYNTTGPQCLSKFSGLKRTYKNIKDHNNKSGNGLKTWPYFNLMDSLIGSKPYMSPVATASSSKRDEPEPNTLLNVNEDHPRKKPNHTAPVDKVLSAIEKIRKLTEESKERRHKEKMEQKKEALSLLGRLVNILEKKSDDD